MEMVKANADLFSSDYSGAGSKEWGGEHCAVYFPIETTDAVTGAHTNYGEIINISSIEIRKLQRGCSKFGIYPKFTASPINFSECLYLAQKENPSYNHERAPTGDVAKKCYS